MLKRAVAGFLWVYLATYAWSMYSGLAGIDFLWGPAIVLGTVSIFAIAKAFSVGSRAETTPSRVPTQPAVADRA